MVYLKGNILKAITLVFVVLSIYARVIFLPYSNDDLSRYNLPWYQKIVDQGIGNTLGTAFTNYNPPYTYFLALATLSRKWIPPIIALKLIPIAFDLIGSIYIFKIVRQKYRKGEVPYLASATYFAAPTVMMNSSLWGQVDSLYTALLLASFYYIMAKKPFIAMGSFGLSFAFKAQAIFFVPFLCALYLRKRISWIHFAVIPLIYAVAILPVITLGRPILNSLTVYATQSSYYNRLSVNAPNPYILFSNQFYSSVMPLGIAIAILLITYWVYSTAKDKTEFNSNKLILIALISLSVMPYLLPKMHDRYFYPADVFSIVVAFYWPALWFVPLLFQLSSSLSISVFLFNGNWNLVALAALLNTLTIATLLRKQRLLEKRVEINPKIAFTASWIVSILTPMLLIGLGVKIILTPLFPRIEYSLPYFPADRFGFSKSERYTVASLALEYLSNDKGVESLAPLKVNDGKPMFNKLERARLEHGKIIVSSFFAFWRASLLGLFFISLFAWIGDWLPWFRNGIGRGGIFSFWLALTAGGLALFLRLFNSALFNQALVNISGLFFDPKSQYFMQSDVLSRLFPIPIWRDAFFFIIVFLATGGAFVKFCAKVCLNQEDAV